MAIAGTAPKQDCQGQGQGKKEGTLQGVLHRAAISGKTAVAGFYYFRENPKLRNLALQ
jgi:hypothetical protein